jgi:hypothetical protein
MFSAVYSRIQPYTAVYTDVYCILHVWIMYQDFVLDPHFHINSKIKKVWSVYIFIFIVLIFPPTYFTGMDDIYRVIDTRDCWCYSCTGRWPTNRSSQSWTINHCLKWFMFISEVLHKLTMWYEFVSTRFTLIQETVDVTLEWDDDIRIEAHNPKPFNIVWNGTCFHTIHIDTSDCWCYSCLGWWMMTFQ